MTVAVETLEGLERKVTVVIPAADIEKKVAARLKEITPKAKIPGFRPGKVPVHLIKQRYENSIRHEIVNDLIRPSLVESLKELHLVPAGYPDINPEHVIAGKDFTYTAQFEIFPTFEIKNLNQEEDEIEIVSAEASEEDIDNLINKLREQEKTWIEVSRPSISGDKLIIDFKGFIDDVAFSGGEAEGHEIILGEKTMIEGFEDGLIGANAGQSVTLNITFPENYYHAYNAGKAARFEVKINSVLEGQLPELNEEFVKKFNIADGLVSSLRSDLQENMRRELERAVGARNRDSIFTVFLKKNPFDLPNVLVNDEIEELKHQMYHQLFGHEHHDNEKIPYFPRELFLDKAMRRVHLGLLFSEYVKQNAIEIDRARVEAKIQHLAQSYENPEQVKAYFRGNKERMTEIETLVMEEMVSELIMKDAKLVFKKLSYDDLMNKNKSQGA